MTVKWVIDVLVPTIMLVVIGVLWVVITVVFRDIWQARSTIGK